MKNIDICYNEAIGFSSIGHFENFTKYLFNISQKHENEQTKHNLYFCLENGEYKNIKEAIQAEFGTNYDDRKFREVAQKRLLQSVKTLQKPYTPYTQIKSDIFYMDFGVERTFDGIYRFVANNMQDIIKYQPDEVKSMRKIFVFVALHLNQATPHLHRLFVLPKE